MDSRGLQPARQTRFGVLQKWEGVVSDVGDEAFRARLTDLTGDHPDQEAEIYVDEISPRDRKRIGPGAIFYWYVGYRDEPNGDRERASRIRFRRLPSLDRYEVESAERAARALRDRLGWK